MRHLLLIPLICAIFTIAGVAPHPVSTASIALSTTHGVSLELLPLSPHSATTPTTSSHACDNLHNCRTLSSIVQSSLLTILACVWFAVHHNIPAPRKERASETRRNVFIKAGHFLWDKLLDQRAAMIVLFATLIAPEWMLGNAQLQAHTAWRLAKKLEDARRTAAKAWKNGHRDSADDSTSGGEKSGGPTVSLQGVSEVPITSFRALEAAELLHKADAPWKMSHAFLVIMGGFQFYTKNGSLHPLTPANAIELVSRGQLVPPTDAELASLSKGDPFSKFVLIVQSLWFVVQCIARRIDHLPVTSLEVMTLGYTFMTVALYLVWWNKPLNVGCAIRIPAEPVKHEVKEEYGYTGEKMDNRLIGIPDWFIDVSLRQGVPTFHAGTPTFVDAVRGNYALAPVTMAFGAIHCIAWNYTFPSHIEGQLWRWSSIAIIAAPLAVALFAFPKVWSILYHKKKYTMTEQRAIVRKVAMCMTPFTIVYVAGRLILITIALTALRALPPAAYRTVNWTTFFPHF